LKNKGIGYLCMSVCFCRKSAMISMRTAPDCQQRFDYHHFKFSNPQNHKFPNLFFENAIIIPTFAVQNSDSMSKVCVLTGKRPITGNTVSHSNIKTKRRFLPNLQQKRFFLAEEDKWVTLKLSTEGIRTINKKGLYAVVKELRKAGEKI
jgi:large subunit ribosomal protein L28